MLTRCGPAARPLVLDTREREFESLHLDKVFLKIPDNKLTSINGLCYTYSIGKEKPILAAGRAESINASQDLLFGRTTLFTCLG